MRDRPLALAKLHLEHAIERNAVLVVAIRHLAHEEHRRGRGHDSARQWTGCDHAVCTRARQAIDGPAHTWPVKDNRRSA